MKNKKETVCAVVVTYNRKELLLECLEALCKQTRPIQGIYLIDNASTDGTPAFLLEKGYIKELPPKNLTGPWEKEFEIKNLTDGKIIKLHYVRMHENTGGAGGFHEGVKRAYEKGYDWLWLMDDDVEPIENALKILLYYKYISKCIHPSKKYSNGSRIPWECFLDITTGRKIRLNDISFKYGKTFCYVNVGCFEGMLIHREIVSKIGYPDKTFFIVDDDTIYGFLASLYTNNIYIKEICFIKKRKSQLKKILFLKSIRNSDVGLYYTVRNSFLIAKYLKRYAFFNFLGYIWLFWKSLRSLGGVIIFDRKISRLLLVIKAIFDGLKLLL